jgi:hypothetical protein
MTLKNRMARLEKAKENQDPGPIIFDWGGDKLTINGQELTREEVDRLFPESTRLVIEWDVTPIPNQDGKE